MKKKLYGPSLYYASDKNIYDALSQNKVDLITISKLFLRRNTLVSKKTSREELAKQFSILNHDYYDHKNIGDKLGVATRRERTSSTFVKGIDKDNQQGISSAANKLKKELEKTGDVVHVSRTDGKVSLAVQYSTVDYSKNELSQVQVFDGVIELVEAEDGYVINNTQNEYITKVKETLVSTIQKEIDVVLEEVQINLADVNDAKLRSKFFYELTNSLDGYKRIDVTDVYVFKAPPVLLEDEEVSNEDILEDTHVERVFLKGKGVSRSEILHELLEEENYYITKIRWTVQLVMGKGDVYEIEAVFTDPKDCTDFSFMVVGVYPFEEGKVNNKRRTPSKLEIEPILRVVEKRARELMEVISLEYEETD